MTQEQFDIIAAKAIADLSKESLEAIVADLRGDSRIEDDLVTLTMNCPEIKRAVVRAAFIIKRTEFAKIDRELISFLLCMFQGGLKVGKALSEYESLENLVQKGGD